MKSIIILQRKMIGLLKDAEIIKNIILSNGLECLIVSKDDYKTHEHKMYKIKIFIEHLQTNYLQFVQSEFTCFIPNVELLEEWDMKFLKYVDYIICKNKQTYTFFEKENIEKERLVYTKFTSPDNYVSGKKQYSLFGHFAGTSSFKGTKELLECWIEYNGFLDIDPNIKLIIVRKISGWNSIDKVLSSYIKTLPFKKTDIPFKNGLSYINIILYDYLEEKEYNEITNYSGVHICPSLAEGFGHYINEARAKKAIVITTNAEPMNELIVNKNLLLDIEKTKNISEFNNQYAYKSSIQAHFFDKKDLLNKIKYISSLSEKDKIKIGNENNHLYKKDDLYFNNTFSKLIQKIQNTTMSTSNVFDKIYKYKRWSFNENPLSGEGSTLEATKETIKIIDNVIKKYNIKSIYDSACGDMTWMPYLLKLHPDIHYIGGDVSEYVINMNKKRDGLKKYEFKVIDFSKDIIPKVDLILCRDVIQHLNSNSVLQGLHNFSKSNSKYLLITNYLKTTKEKSQETILSGYTNYINLYLEPFNLPKANECFDEKFDDKFLCLWKLPLLSKKEIDLSDYEKKIYSQNGEDGILEKIFEIISTTNKYYVEFGVENGDERNTRYLMEKYKWEGLLMDGGYSNEKINLKKEFITKNNINYLFEKYNVPNEFDLLSIDIDYNDWYVLEAILSKQKFKPRVISMEYNASLHLEDKIVIYDPNYMWEWNMSDYFNSSLYSIHTLLQKYNYTIVYCENKGVNLFAIHNSISIDIFKNSGNIHLLYKPPLYGLKKVGHKKDSYKRHYLTSTEALKHTYNHYDYSLIDNIVYFSDLLTNKKFNKKFDIHSYISSLGIYNNKILYVYFVNSLIKHYKTKLEKPVNSKEFTIQFNNKQYYVSTHLNDSVIFKKLTNGYFYEIYNTFIISTFASKDDIFIDVGANIGSMTLPISSMVKTIISFEPFNETFTILDYNKKRNNLNNVILYNNSVGHTNMITTLSDKITDFNINNNYKKVVKTITKTKKLNYGAIQLGKDGQETEMVTIDSLKMPRVDFLKVDTEGSETLVFFGAKETIIKHKPIILFEHNWQTITKEMIDSMKISDDVLSFNILDFCKELGYDTIIESNKEDFFLIPDHRKQIHENPYVKLKKVNKISLPDNHKKYKNLYKYIKPKW